MSEHAPQLRAYMPGRETPAMRAWLDQVEASLNGLGVATCISALAKTLQAQGHTVGSFSVLVTDTGLELEVKPAKPGPFGPRPKTRRKAGR